MARRRGVLATVVQMQREAERSAARRTRAAAAAQREAARAHAARLRAGIQDQKARERSYLAARAEEVAQETRVLDEQVQELEGILSVTLLVDDYLDLDSLKSPPALPLFDLAEAGPPPPEPRPEAFVVPPPSALSRVLGSTKHMERLEQQRHAYEAARAVHAVELKRHAERVEALRQRNGAERRRLSEEHRKHVEEVDALQSGLAARVPLAVVRYLDLVLEASSYPEGFPHTWTLSYNSTTSVLVVEHDLPPRGVVPEAKAYKYVKASDDVVPVARPVSQVRALYAQTLARTALRVVHELLEADRGGTARTIVYNGYVSGVDSATGRPSRACVLALATSRERFLSLELAKVDPTACLTHLEARVSKDPGRLLAVEPIVVEGSLELGSDDGEPVPPADRPAARTTRVPEDGSAATDARPMAAGQNIVLTGQRLHVSLRGARADLSVLLLGSDGRVAQDDDFIFYNNPRSEDGSVRLEGGDDPSGALVELSRVAARHERLVFVASVTDGDLSAAEVVVRQPEGGSDMLIRRADELPVTALLCCEVYRREGLWRLRAVGQGWDDGLAGLARDFGVDVT